MRFEAVHPGTVAVWRVQSLVAIAVALLALAALFAPLLAGGALAMAALIAWLVALLVLAALGWWLPEAWYRRLRYCLDERGLSVERGLLWRHRITVPRVRVQHSDVSQGPLQRVFGVATLRLYTAGSRFTVTTLPGLEHDTALALRERLLREGDGDAV
ncbi:PH domain-containing protein [Alloalcanivorax marinus]|uniref:PH domain-containing protein n=1 Tax=Alloalcanivorax marinus TaxID=1177169 RepID=UPI001931B4CC|nr:PH domain-containing protein [Alloalcanivorax marinus]MBL7251611.1 PH domain-containing protein [Alloalcanivorax marinus]